MNKIFYITLLALTLLVGANVVGAAQSVDVSLLRYEPVPAQPGDTLDVFIQLDNSDDETVRNAQVRIIDNSAFTVLGQETITAGTIASQSVYVARFRVQVGQGVSGEQILRVETRQEGVEWTENSFSIQVQPQDSAVFIANVKTDANKMGPGDEVLVTLTIENLANTLLRDVTVQMDLEDTPFVPATGSSTRKISTLGAQRSQEITFVLAIQPSASADNYRIPLTVSFLDEEGNTQTQTDVIGLQVQPEIRVRAYLDSVAQTEEGTEVAIRLVNQGLSEVQFAQASVIDGESYTVRTQDQHTYVGNIDSDDWETLRVIITTEAEEITLPITYSFTDGFAQEYEQTEQFTFKVPPKPQGGPGVIWIVLIIALLGIIGYFWWKKRK